MLIIFTLIDFFFVVCQFDCLVWLLVDYLFLSFSRDLVETPDTRYPVVWVKFVMSKKTFMFIVVVALYLKYTHGSPVMVRIFHSFFFFFQTRQHVSYFS